MSAGGGFPRVPVIGHRPGFSGTALVTARSLRCFPALLLLAAPASAQILDRTFGTQGKATVVFDVGVAKTDEAIGVFELDDGRYLTVGHVDVDNANGSVVGIGLARLTANGALDPTFDGDGKRVKDAGLTAVHGAALEEAFSSPGLIVTGAVGADSAFVRFNFDGSDAGTVVWDASGAGLADRATHAFGTRLGERFVAGVFDSNATSVTDLDTYVARVESSGVVTVYGRDELGGSDADNDRIVGIADRSNFQAGSTIIDAIAVLADNNSPDFVGTYMLFARSGGARLANLRLEAPLPLMRGCNAAYEDFYSASIAKVSDRYHVIVGDLRSNGIAKQTFTMVIDAVDVQVEALVCSPERTTIESVADAVVTDFDDRFGDLHIAMTREARIGYWRWTKTVLPGNNSPFIYLPDPTYNGGKPFSVEFASASGTPPLGTATGITVRDGHPVVIGSRLWKFDQTVIDFDYALFRPNDDVVFGHGFEN